MTCSTVIDLIRKIFETVCFGTDQPATPILWRYKESKIKSVYLLRFKLMKLYHLCEVF
jgi:hypothetical protein